MEKNLFALVDEDGELVYTVGCFQGHGFREYPDGKIEPANEQEVQILREFGF